MANEQNLKSLKDRTTKEKREIALKGGKASGQARREKKLLKDTLQALLELKDEDGITGQEQICLALFKKAKIGDTKAFEVIRDTTGQIIQQKVQVENVPIIKDDV